MPYITDINADGALDTALVNFHNTCNTYADQLGLTPADVAAISNASTLFNTLLNGATAAKAAAKDAVSAKDAQKKVAKGLVSKWAKIFRANADIPDNILSALMLPPHATPGTKNPPTQPLDLVGSADGNGLVSLKWKRNGNIHGTTFVVEMRTSPSGPWTISGTTTQAKFRYQATPGSYIGFRVTAVRREIASAPSVPFELWVSGGELELKVAA